MARKFIIQDNTLKLGNVDMHYELKNKEGDIKVIGGGYWYLDKDKTTIYLYGKSIDFGKVTIEDLKEVKENGIYSPFLESLEWKWLDSNKIDDLFFSNKIDDVLENGITIN